MGTRGHGGRDTGYGVSSSVDGCTPVDVIAPPPPLIIVVSSLPYKESSAGVSSFVTTLAPLRLLLLIPYRTYITTLAQLSHSSTTTSNTSLLSASLQLAFKAPPESCHSERPGVFDQYKGRVLVTMRSGSSTGELIHCVCP